MRIRRGWRTVLTSLFHNVCGWQKKISLFTRMTKKKKKSFFSVLQYSQGERTASTMMCNNHAKKPVIVHGERLMKRTS